MVNSNFFIDKLLIDMLIFCCLYCFWLGIGDIFYLDLVMYKEKNNKYNWREVLRGNEINELFIMNYFEFEKNFLYVFLVEFF